MEERCVADEKRILVMYQHPHSATPFLIALRSICCLDKFTSSRQSLSNWSQLVAISKEMYLRRNGAPPKLIMQLVPRPLLILISAPSCSHFRFPFPSVRTSAHLGDLFDVLPIHHTWEFWAMDYHVLNAMVVLKNL